MASKELNSSDEEIRELIQNYKYKKATIYEPCKLNNIKDCLIGLTEEFSLLNIGYHFNPHTDAENDSLRPEAFVQLINSVRTLLYYHKNITEKVERLTEHNNVLEDNNIQGSLTAVKLKNKLLTQHIESKACLASSLRLCKQFNEVINTFEDSRNRLKRVIKQGKRLYGIYAVKISRLKKENNKLLNRRKKLDGYTSCPDVCDGNLIQLKEREREQRALITQLQNKNKELLTEVLTLKDKLILKGINSVTIEKK